MFPNVYFAAAYFPDNYWPDSTIIVGVFSPWWADDTDELIYDLVSAG